MPDGPLGDQSIDPLVIWVFVAGVVIAVAQGRRLRSAPFLLARGCIPSNGQLRRA